MKERKEATVSYLAFYPSYYETIMDLLPKEQDQLSAMKALIEYGLYGEEPPADIPPVAEAIFRMAKPTIDKHRKDIENGKKGGRPKKETESDDSEEGVKRGVKRGVNTKKEKEKKKERDTEKEKDISFSFPYSEFEDADARALDSAARTSNSFTFADVLNTIQEHDINLTEDEAHDFYKWMEKYNWQINGNRVTKLENALRGYAKKHHKESDSGNNETYSKEDAEKARELDDTRADAACARVYGLFGPHELTDGFTDEIVEKDDKCEGHWNAFRQTTRREEWQVPSAAIPKRLRVLMCENKISEWDLKNYVGIRLKWVFDISKSKAVKSYSDDVIDTLIYMWDDSIVPTFKEYKRS